MIPEIQIVDGARKNICEKGAIIILLLVDL